MFDQVNGLPVHVLVVHAAVVFVPLLVLSAMLYAFVPSLRARLGWVVALLSVGAPACALVAMLSGERFYDRRYGDVPAEAVHNVQQHASFGTRTFWFTLGLGVVSALLLFVTGRRGRAVSKAAEIGLISKAAEIGLIVAVVAFAAVAGYYVFETGDSGAQSVHGGA
jgi:hypothetical protein